MIIPTTDKVVGGGRLALQIVGAAALVASPVLAMNGVQIQLGSGGMINHSLVLFAGIAMAVVGTFLVFRNVWVRTMLIVLAVPGLGFLGFVNGVTVGCLNGLPASCL